MTMEMVEQIPGSKKQKVKWESLDKGEDISIRGLGKSFLYGLLANDSTPGYKSMCRACYRHFSELEDGQTHPCPHVVEFREITHRCEEVFLRRWKAGDRIKKKRAKSTAKNSTSNTNGHSSQLVPHVEINLNEYFTGILAENTAAKEEIPALNILIARLETQIKQGKKREDDLYAQLQQKNVFKIQNS